MKLAYKLFNTRGEKTLQSYNRTPKDVHGLGLIYKKGQMTVPKIMGSKLFVLEGPLEELKECCVHGKLQLWLVECDVVEESKMKLAENWLINGAHFIRAQAVYQAQLMNQFIFPHYTRFCNWVIPIKRIK